jgi:hypothetical protein
MCLQCNGNENYSVIAGYGNEEVVPLKKLQPSQGQEARKLQEAAAAQDVNEQPVSPVGLKLSSVAEGLCHILQHSALPSSPPPFFCLSVRVSENRYKEKCQK